MSSSPSRIGPKTLAALELDNEQPLLTPPWIIEAKKYLGLNEVKDAKKLDKVLKLDASLIPWCGAFVGMCIAAVLPKEPLPANPLWH